MEEWPLIWRVRANILKNSRGRPKRRDPPLWAFGEVLITPHRKTLPCDEKDKCASGLDLIMSFPLKIAARCDT